MIHKFSLLFRLVALFSIISLNGCGDEVTVNPESKNKPPRILLSGPEYDSTKAIRAPLPEFWVIVGDEDGPEDISAVIFRISNINLNKIIVRPDDADEECRRPYYANMDTIDIMPFLEKHVFSVNNLPLNSGTDGTYRAYLNYSILTEGGLEQHSNVFGLFVKDCRWGYDYLYMLEDFGLYPPAIAIPRDVYVTYAEFTLSEVSITAYDQAGAVATKIFPDMTCYFTNTLEEQTLP